VDQGWVVFWAIVAALGSLAVYVGHCRFRPFADCRKCDGRGKFRSRTGRSWRRCRRCKGSGDRIRYGRKMWTKLAAVKKDAVG
jgi:hypothetical protein